MNLSIVFRFDPVSSSLRFEEIEEEFTEPDGRRTVWTDRQADRQTVAIAETYFDERLKNCGLLMM